MFYGRRLVYPIITFLRCIFLHEYKYFSSFGAGNCVSNSSFKWMKNSPNQFCSIRVDPCERWVDDTGLAIPGSTLWMMVVLLAQHQKEGWQKLIKFAAADSKESTNCKLLAGLRIAIAHVHHNSKPLRILGAMKYYWLLIELTHV